jgi:hypothetical protein
MHLSSCQWRYVLLIVNTHVYKNQALFNLTNAQ